MRGVKILLGAILLLLAVIAWALLRPRPADRLAARVEEAIDEGPAREWYSHAHADLLNLESLQDIHRTSSPRYARTVAEAELTTFPDVAITIDAAENWWSATATDYGRSFSCVVYHGASPSGPPRTLRKRTPLGPDIVTCDDGRG